MRIAVVHNLPPGGARRRLSSQMTHLRSEVVEICLESASPITEAPVVIPLRRRAPQRGRLLRPPLRYLDHAALEVAWHRAAAAVRHANADVLYLNPCQFMQAPPLLRDGVPPALYFCDEPRRVDSEEAISASRNSLTKPLYAAIYARGRRLDRANTRRAARIAANSRYAASEIERVYGRSAEVVTMGVPDSLRVPPAADAGFLLSVGALLPTKGHDLVIQVAAAALERPPVVVVAPRPAYDEEHRLEGLAESAGVDLSIRVGIRDLDLGKLYASAHATLYLAQREPLGLVSLEAQACGSPVIVAAEGGLPETIVEGVTGWQAPRDPQMVAAIVDRLSDRQLRERISREARRHGRGRSWEASAAQIERLLVELHSTIGRDHEN
jgi:glycosyltransferase involved in cell wall biosynthesis